MAKLIRKGNQMIAERKTVSTEIVCLDQIVYRIATGWTLSDDNFDKNGDFVGDPKTGHYIIEKIEVVAVI